MKPLLESPLPADRVEVRVWTLGTVTGLSELRAELRRTVADVPGFGADMPDRMILVASELATNALRHGRPPTVVTLFQSGEGLVLDVADHDLDGRPEFADVAPAGVGGRGLHFVRAFSGAVAWFRTEHTKHVWATFPIAARPAA